VPCCIGEQNVSAVFDDTRRHYVVLTFWDSQVAVVGIGLCMGVIVASLSFVCYQRFTLRRLRAKQDTQTPAYRALVASKQKQVDVATVRQGNHSSEVMMMMTSRLEPRSPRVTTACLSSAAAAAHRAVAVKQSTSSPARQHQATPSSARRHRDAPTTTASPVTSSWPVTSSVPVTSPMTSRMTPSSVRRHRDVPTTTASPVTSSSSMTSSAPMTSPMTSSSGRRHLDGATTTVSPVTSAGATAQQLSIFTPTRNESPALQRSSRARCKSPREAFECVCLVAGSGSMLDQDTVMLETRPPVEGRDSISVEHVLDTAAANDQERERMNNVELKIASYVPPTDCSVAVRRCLERVDQVTRGTSPMSASDVDILPDISALLTSSTETDDVMTLTGAASSSSLSDLVVSCDVEFDDSDDCIQRPHRTSLGASHQRPYKAPWTRKRAWTARKRQGNAMLEPDVYYC